jgi:hypothetical protein
MLDLLSSTGEKWVRKVATESTTRNGSELMDHFQSVVRLHERRASWHNATSDQVGTPRLTAQLTPSQYSNSFP